MYCTVRMCVRGLLTNLLGQIAYISLHCPENVCGFLTEGGKVTLKSNGDEALSNEFLLKRNANEALNDVFPQKVTAMKCLTLRKKL